MALKVAAAASLIVMVLKLLTVADFQPVGESGTSTSQDTEGIVSRGPSCAVGQYDEALSRGVENLSYQQMYDLIKYNSTDYVLVDVRRADEYAQGHLPTAFLVTTNGGLFEDHIDFRQIMCGRKFVVLYCRSGRRARQAANNLQSILPVKIYPGSWKEWSAKNPSNVVQ